MPMTGATLDSASIDVSNTVVSWVGTNLGENQYAICAARVHCGSTWTVLTITDWGGLGGTGAAVSALSAGVYVLEITTADRLVLTLADAFTISAAAASMRHSSCAISIGIGI
jgi:hypothetical protein